MIKSELIQHLASKQSYLDHHDVEAVVAAIIGKMIETLANGERIEIRGFGSFTVKPQKARMGRNPRTGEIVSVSKKHIIQFKAGAQLRERVNDSANQYQILDWDFL